MKRIRKKIPAIQLTLSLLLIFLIAFFSMAMQAREKMKDIWEQLGLTQVAGNKNIDQSFLQGHFYYFGAKNARNLAMNDRVAMVNQMVDYAKKYVNSAEFKTTYQEYQNKRSETIRRSLPKKPQAKTIESAKAEEKLMLEKRLTATEANLNSPNANVKKSAGIQVENIKKEIQALDNPDNPSIKRRMDQANRNYEYQLKVYNEAMKNFDAKYPSDPKPMLKQRLQEILNITADVDYAAETKAGENGLKVFVNPAYERKPLEWKLAFRAGKPATDAVRAAAEQWLKELE